ncbi:hypothetical protein [Mycobacterium sp. DL440]|uniref:hypothetical protein n=1 Tax=Mycobacterium sp. DL440 TaxID=2675523 RepID=UPI00141FBCA5|nr:hypothetical protein [Mycobacterium sp. DL440]
MAASLDVAARLDEGQAAVDTVAEYVWACHLLGFGHADLTRYRYQVRDWYAAEDGLDLRMLDAECTSLVAAAAAAEQALRLQDNHFLNLSRAWQGAGARASMDFLARHATSAAQVSAGIRGAAATLTRLRDNLWDAVDAKVSAALQIEERQAGQRGTWLAAARAVSTGVGDRSVASELIDTQVKPFVANDIGGDWLTAMRSTTRAVADAYAQALTALRAEVQPVFGIPGELGPVWVAPSPPPAAGATAALSAPGLTAAPASMPPWPTTPSAVPAAMSAAPASMPAMPAPWPPLGAEPTGPATAPVESAAPLPASPAGLGQGLGGGGLPGLGGMPDIGSGLAGSGQQLADLFGGLLGSSADSLPDDIGELPDDDVDDPDPAADETGEDAHEGADDEGADADAAEDTDGVDEAAGAEAGEPGADVVEETEPQSVPLGAEPVPTVVDPLPPVAEPGPPAEPLAAPAGETPCAIAADELPQVGE